MRQSRLFTKTRKEAPKDEVAKNAQLLMRAGYIHKEMAGVYAYLPLGLRVLERIKNVVREEMNALDGQEIIMTALQRKELWERTDRWDDEHVDVWFKSQFKSGGEVGFGWSHEEPITDMMKNYIASYRDLPVHVYQFQTKLRNELRSKSGIMRGKEFVMKDSYSYNVDEATHEKFYNSMIDAYHRVFKRLGVGDRTFLTFASGGAFTQFSHEFQTVSEVGEDKIYLHRDKKLAINQEVLTPGVMSQLGVHREELEEVSAIEVGNIFSFGSVKSDQLGLVFKNEQGVTQPVILGSYGIGITRLMGVLAEVLADDRGIVWPKEAAPFDVHLVAINIENVDVRADADRLYHLLSEHGVEVLYDDRDVRTGEKLADSDLMGIPTRLVVSERTLAAGEIEVINRKDEKKSMISDSKIIEFIADGLKKA